MPLPKSKLRGIVATIQPSALNGTKKPVRDTVDAFGTKAVQEIVGDGVDFDMRDDEVARFLRDYGGERINGINRTTRKKVGKLLSRSAAEDWSLARTKRELTQTFGFSKQRSRVVAVQEINRSGNFSTWKGYDQVGVEKKQWLSTEDGSVRDTHKGLDGVIKKMSAFFKTKNGSALYPCNFGVAEEDINCRCGILPVFDERRATRWRAGYWKVFDAQRKPWQRRYAQALYAALVEQRNMVIAAVEAAWEN